jgi:CRP/FNR family transcriptional regulator, nitrogen oxide reductase regulator
VLPLKNVAQGRLFQGMTPEEAMAILRCASRLIWAPGAWVCQEGGPAVHIFILEQGRVGLSQLSADGRRVLLRFMSPGELFGYSALAEHGVYAVSARAVQECSVAVWRVNVFRQLMIEYPRLASNAFHMSVELLIGLARRVQSLATKSAQQRVAESLADLASQIGLRLEHGIMINGSLTFQDLADLSSTTIYTVSRVLSGWERLGMVKKGRGRITVFDVDALLAMRRVS